MKIIGGVICRFKLTCGIMDMITYEFFKIWNVRILEIIRTGYMNGTILSFIQNRLISTGILTKS